MLHEGQLGVHPPGALGVGFFVHAHAECFIGRGGDGITQPLKEAGALNLDDDGKLRLIPLRNRIYANLLEAQALDGMPEPKKVDECDILWTGGQVLQVGWSPASLLHEAAQAPHRKSLHEPIPHAVNAILADLRTSCLLWARTTLGFTCKGAHSVRAPLSGASPCWAAHLASRFGNSNTL